MADLDLKDFSDVIIRTAPQIEAPRINDHVNIK
jgi:hypothetical protein